MPIPIPTTNLKDEKRFWSKIDAKNPSECWPWLRSTDGRYGKMCIGTVEIKAHRLSYYFTFGVDPGKLEVCHSCDNPPCCNPAHLFLGSHAENLRDMVKKNRHSRIGLKGEEAGRAKLTESQVVKLRRRYADGKATQSEIAQELGVTRALIGRIVTGVAWSHLPIIAIQFTSRRGMTIPELQNGERQ